MTLARRMATALATTLIAAGALFVPAGAPAQAAPAAAAFGCVNERLALLRLRAERTALVREFNNPTRSQDEILADIAFVDGRIELAQAAYDACIEQQGGGLV